MSDQYKYDPELAPMVPHLPKSDFSEPQKARESMKDIIAQFNAEVDVSGLNIEDITVPGPLDAPELIVRVYIPEKP